MKTEKDSVPTSYYFADEKAEGLVLGLCQSMGPRRNLPSLAKIRRAADLLSLTFSTLEDFK